MKKCKKSTSLNGRMEFLFTIIELLRFLQTYGRTNGWTDLKCRKTLFLKRSAKRNLSKMCLIELSLKIEMKKFVEDD